jgi:hypothetical protein
LVTRFNTVQQAQFYIEHLGADFGDYLIEHRHYGEALTKAETQLREVGRVQRLDRRFVANFLFGVQDIVVVVGQDGLVANTLKYLDGQPVIGVNPDPARWDGVLLPFTVKELARVVPEVVRRRRPLRAVTMAEAVLNNGQTLQAVNDLFVGQRSHVSARYSIAIGGREERQSSSGVIVSTGLGSTGWLRSIYAGWHATTRTLLHDAVHGTDDGSFAWDADYLHYFVREPYPSRITGADIVIGRVARDEHLVLVSQMPENGVIFSDGIEADHLDFNSGTEARIGIATKQGQLVV